MTTTDGHFDPSYDYQGGPGSGNGKYTHVYGNVYEGHFVDEELNGGTRNSMAITSPAVDTVAWKCRKRLKL